MPPRTGSIKAWAFGFVQLKKFGNVFWRSYLLDRHGEELVARVAVLGDGRIVDIEKRKRVHVVQPHRLRMALEQRPVVAFRDRCRTLVCDPVSELVVDGGHQLVKILSQRDDL